MIRVLIVEDHPFIIKAVRDELSRDPEFEVVGELRNSLGLAQLVRDKHVDVLVLDLLLEGDPYEPVTTVRSLTKRFSNLSVLILTGTNQPLLMKALIDAGALGYILKSDDLSLLARGVRAVHNRVPFYSDRAQMKHLELAQTDQLTESDRAIIRLIAAGLSNEEIASKMYFVEQHIRNEITHIYEKLNLEGDRSINLRVACINKARELGLLNDP